MNKREARMVVLEMSEEEAKQLGMLARYVGRTDDVDPTVFHFSVRLLDLMEGYE